VTVVNRAPNSGVVLSLSETFEAILTTGEQFGGTEQLNPIIPAGIFGGHNFAGYSGNLGECHDDPVGPSSYGFEAVTQHDVTFSDGQHERGTSFAQTFPIYDPLGNIVDTGFRENFLADSTTTSVTCMPTMLPFGQSTTCTAIVTDPAASEHTSPTGTVNFTSAGPGTFSNAATCTLAATTTGIARCQVTYRPSATRTSVRSETIIATYNDDNTHTPSSGSTTVTVQPGLHTAPPPQRPTLSALGVSPRKFTFTGRFVKGRCVAVTGGNRTSSVCARAIALRVGYKLTVAGRVGFTIKQQLTGRVVKGRCVPVTRPNHKQRGCTRLIPLIGSFTRTTAGGSKSFTFNRQLGGRKLRPGRYLLTATPTANGRTGDAQSISFEILR